MKFPVLKTSIASDTDFSNEQIVESSPRFSVSTRLPGDRKRISWITDLSGFLPVRKKRGREYRACPDWTKSRFGGDPIDWHGSSRPEVSVSDDRKLSLGFNLFEGFWFFRFWRHV